MSGAPQVISRTQPGISPEQARDARALAWAYAFQCFHSRVDEEGGPYTAPDDAKEIKSVRATHHYTK